MKFVYFPELLLGNKFHFSTPKCLAIGGDYILIGKDLALGKKNPHFTTIHEHMMVHKQEGRQFIRKGKIVGWAADLVFLDLPFGGLTTGSIMSPIWDVLTEDHVRYGISLAVSSLADSGWLLIMASIGGIYKSYMLGWLT